MNDESRPKAAHETPGTKSETNDTAPLARPVVHELAQAGLSVRAIAPVVGMGKTQVAEYVVRGQVSGTGHLNTETGEVSDDYPAPDVGPAGVDPGREVPR